MSVTTCHLMNSFSIFGDIPTLWPPPPNIDAGTQISSLPCNWDAGIWLELHQPDVLWDNSFLKWVKCASNSCSQLSIVWMGDGRGIELLLGAAGEKLGFGGNHLLISSVLHWGLGDCFRQLNPSLISSPHNHFVSHPLL